MPDRGQRGNDDSRLPDGTPIDGFGSPIYDEEPISADNESSSSPSNHSSAARPSASASSNYPAGASWNGFNTNTNHDSSTNSVNQVCLRSTTDIDQPGPSTSGLSYSGQHQNSQSLIDSESLNNLPDSGQTYSRVPRPSQAMDESGAAGYSSNYPVNGNSIDSEPLNTPAFADHSYARIRPSLQDIHDSGPSSSSSSHTRAAQRSDYESSLWSRTWSYAVSSIGRQGNQHAPNGSSATSAANGEDWAGRSATAAGNGEDWVGSSATSAGNGEAWDINPYVYPEPIHAPPNSPVNNNVVINNNGVGWNIINNMYTGPIHNHNPPNSPVNNDVLNNGPNAPAQGMLGVLQGAEDLDLLILTDQELQAMTQAQIRSRRIAQSRLENNEVLGLSVPPRMEVPSDYNLNAEWECAICQQTERIGQFALLECCRHQQCAVCFANQYRAEWNKNRSLRIQPPSPVTCCYCRRPVTLWCRSSHRVIHGSDEKTNLLRDEIQRRLRVMGAGMTDRERTRAEQLFGPLDQNRELWATDGWFAMYFGHMEEELRVAGFEADVEGDSQGSDPPNGACGFRDQ